MLVDVTNRHKSFFLPDCKEKGVGEDRVLGASYLRFWKVCQYLADRGFLSICIWLNLLVAWFHLLRSNQKIQSFHFNRDKRMDGRTYRGTHSLIQIGVHHTAIERVQSHGKFLRTFFSSICKRTFAPGIWSPILGELNVNPFLQWHTFSCLLSFTDSLPKIPLHF